ncbi:MAG: hypothetical protein QME81_07255 [bacterium]|nr:hypothetical protein [bacterium]
MLNLQTHKDKVLTIIDLPVQLILQADKALKLGALSIVSAIWVGWVEERNPTIHAGVGFRSAQPNLPIS